MTANLSRLATSNAPGICCSADRARSFASILANPGMATSKGDRERRFRGHFSFETAAVGVSRLARLRLLADLSVPCGTARHAHTAGRHRSVQIRRVQTERRNQGHAKPGLLEAGSALPRRD